MSNGEQSSSTSAEEHLLFVLLDSNLPTGGFVASSGLESFITHGFLAQQSYHEGVRRSGSNEENGAVSSKKRRKDQDAGSGITRLATDEMDNYASTTIPFLNDAWKVTNSYLSANSTRISSSQDNGGPLRAEKLDVHNTLNILSALDDYHESTLLSHVSRRASKSQGVALLTLYTKSFAQSETERDTIAAKLVSAYKNRVRAVKSHGHLAICWGIITASLGLSKERSVHLYLFLHARSFLSAGVRLNQIGPYESTSLLMQPFKPLIDKTFTQHKDHTSGILVWRPPTCPLSASTTGDSHMKNGGGMAVTQGDWWSWADEAEISGAATTWPLGEILASRHDLQHTRLFNS